MNNGDVITFNSKKAFTYIKPLGSGGTGDTHLFLDETTRIQFAIKKYVPKDSQFTDEDYRRFVDEIIILFNISHPNIVRIIIFFQKLKQVTFKWNMLMALVLINSNRMDGEKIGMLYFQR